MKTDCATNETSEEIDRNRDRIDAVYKPAKSTGNDKAKNQQTYLKQFFQFNLDEVLTIIQSLTQNT